MNRTLILFSLVGVVSLLGYACAQDAEPPETAEEPAPAKPRPKSDPVAAALLGKAAKRQGAAALAPKGALTSFHVQFKRAVFTREKVNSKGGRESVTIDADSSSTRIDWMAPENLRTAWAVDGRKTLRGHYAPEGRKGLSWSSDGVRDHKILNPKDKRDAASIEQIERDREMIRSLLDVAFLARLLEDGSVWRTSKAAYPVVNPKDTTRVEDAASLRAVTRRRLSKDDARLPLTLWIDATTHEVRAAQVEIGEGRRLTYGLSYHAKFPQVTWAGGKARFPFQVSVYDRTDAKPIMTLFVESVFVNDPAKVNQKTFGLPRTPR